MGKDFWKWLVFSDAGTGLRIGVGIAIFVLMAAWDLRRKGKESRRWREYLFLAAATATALAYGLVNEQITVTISWEYFYYGKGLYGVLGPRTPPAEWPLRLEALILSMKATWTAGLLMGVALLIANNPRKGRPQLPFRDLFRLFPVPVLTAAGLAVVLGTCGYLGLFAGIGAFRELVADGFWRPHHMMCVWCAHLGGYVGGALGTGIAVWLILRARAARHSLTLRKTQ